MWVSSVSSAVTSRWYTQYQRLGAGAVQDSATVPLPATALRFVGGAGRSIRATAETVLDGGPSPPPLMAVTRNSYVWPMVPSLFERATRFVGAGGGAMRAVTVTGADGGPSPPVLAAATRNS